MCLGYSETQIGYGHYCLVFFKQKTAYDMRISDGSSDVCSSDLLDTQGSGVATSVVASGNLTEKLSLRYGVGVFEPANTIALRYKQIGRASCRERVCQYV